jgi:hypothetical protein
MNVNNFNHEYWKGKTYSEFKEHEKHHGFSEEEMKAIYLYLNPVEKPKKAKQTETPM